MVRLFHLQIILFMPWQYWCKHLANRSEAHNQERGRTFGHYPKFSVGWCGFCIYMEHVTLEGEALCCSLIYYQGLFISERNTVILHGWAIAFIPEDLLKINTPSLYSVCNCQHLKTQSDRLWHKMFFKMLWVRKYLKNKHDPPVFPPQALPFYSLLLSLLLFSAYQQIIFISHVGLTSS